MFPVLVSALSLALESEAFILLEFVFLTVEFLMFFISSVYGNVGLEIFSMHLRNHPGCMW